MATLSEPTPAASAPAADRDIHSPPDAPSGSAPQVGEDTSRAEVQTQSISQPIVPPSPMAGKPAPGLTVPIASESDVSDQRSLSSTTPKLSTSILPSSSDGSQQDDEAATSPQSPSEAAAWERRGRKNVYQSGGHHHHGHGHHGHGGKGGCIIL